MGQWTPHYWRGHREDGRVAVDQTVDGQRPPDWLLSPTEITREEYLEIEEAMREAAIAKITEEAAQRKARRTSADDPYTGIAIYQTKAKGQHDSRTVPIGETLEDWRTFEVEFTLDNGRKIRIRNGGDRLYISTVHGEILTLATGGTNTLEIVNLLRRDELIELTGTGRA